MSGQVQVQPDRVSTLPADRVFRLERTKLFQIAGWPRVATPKVRSRAKLRLVQAPNESSQPAFTAQNGAVIHQSTPIAITGCPKAHKAKQKNKKKVKKRKRA